MFLDAFRKSSLANFIDFTFDFLIIYNIIFSKFLFLFLSVIHSFVFHNFVPRILILKFNSFVLIFFRLNPLTRSEGKDVTLLFPNGKSLFDVDWLGIISRKNKVRKIKILYWKSGLDVIKPF